MQNNSKLCIQKAKQSAGKWGNQKQSYRNRFARSALGSWVRGAKTELSTTQ